MAVALNLFVDSLPAGSHILHIGGGASQEAALLNDGGFTVTTADYSINGLHYESTPFRPQHYDGVYCSHTLEHVRNVGLFLDKLIAETKTGGLIALVVPPMKHNIVGGHLSTWNAGLLLYNLIRAGLDCSKAAVDSYGYNCAVLVRKKLAKLPTLNEDNGDIEALAHLFPVPAFQDFDGRIIDCNWHPL